MSHLDPNDTVVAELDVLVSNELAALHSHLVMLQQPLRPCWRPYDSDRSGTTARFKPHARRLELELPLDTKGENYAEVNPGEDHKQLKALALRSSAVADDPGNSFAIGVVRDHQLVLMPVDYALQLRPNMSYLNNADSAAGGKKKDGAAGAAAAAAAADMDSDEEEADEQAMAVEVTVRRRETERQQQARLRSYSYLQQEEEQEAWLPLALHQESSRPAEVLWNKMLSAPEAAEEAEAAAAAAAGGAAAANGEAGPSSSTAAAAAAAATGQQQQQQQQQRQMPPPLRRTEYLHAFVPSRNPAAAAAAALGDDSAVGAAGTSAAAAAAAAAGAGAAAAGGGGAAGGTDGIEDTPLLLGHPNDVATPEMAAAVGPVIKLLMQRHSVCSMANVRQWLQQQQDADQLVRTAAMLSDPVLHGLLQGTGHVHAIKRVYVAKIGGNAATEPLRQVVVRLLMDKATLRKADVMAAAEAAGLASPSESQYQRVMKELCRNNGNHWTIRAAADM